MATLAVDGGTPVRREPLPDVLSPAGRTLGAEERDAVARVLASGVLSSTFGTETPALEAEMAALYDRRHAVASSSGTAALHLAVAAVGAEPGDEIVTTPISDFGTVAPILAQNAVPVFADVDPHTGNLDPDAVASAVTDRTRAILAVHLFGAPAPVAELRAVADDYDILLVEDCAQAWLTTEPDGRLAGTRGDIACFSLQQYKHITAGDGGLAVTDDADLARRMRLFGDKAWDRSSGRLHLGLGLNYRMTELQAAVARAQLAKLPGVLASRRRRAGELVELLAGLPGVVVPHDVESHAWWLFPLVLDDGTSNVPFGEALRAEGVPCAAGYLEVPLHLNPALQDAGLYGTSRYPLTVPPASRVPRYERGLCPRAERLVDETLVTVPWNEGLAADDVRDIAAAVTKVHAGLCAVR